MPKKLIQNLLIIAIVIFAACIRSINIGKFGIGGDEKYSLMVVNGISWEGATQKKVFAKKYFTPKEFWKALSFSDFDEAIIRTDNGNSASFYGALYIWKTIFGQNDGSLRAMGVLFDCCTVFLVFLFCKNILYKPVTGLLAAFLVCIEPFLIGYSHQIRNYPMGIFLVLLSAFLFFKIIRYHAIGKPILKLCFAYGITIVLGILSHFYVVLFIFCQFLSLMLLNYRKFRLIRSVIYTYIISFIFIGLWFTIGSGRYTFGTLKGKDEIFAKIVQNPPSPNIYAAWINAPNFENLKNKIVPILADNFLITNNLFEKLNGKTNFVWSVLLSILLWISYLFTGNRFSKNWIKLMLFLIIFGLFYFVFNDKPFYHLYLSVVFFLFYHTISQVFSRKNEWDFQFGIYSLISIIVPVTITIISAIRVGHTANIYQKYLSFGLPISAILLALGLVNMAKAKQPICYVFLTVFFTYSISIIDTLKLVLNDNFQKYTIYSGTRKENVYNLAASKITALYQKGDTVIYPSQKMSVFDTFDPQMNKPKVSVVDAQLTNIYLPKNAQFIQRVDGAEPNKIFLFQDKLQKKTLIFDFENTKYRY